MGFFKEFGENRNSDDSLNLQDMLESLDQMSLDDALAMMGDAKEAYVSSDESHVGAIERAAEDNTDSIPGQTGGAGGASDMTEDTDNDKMTLEDVWAGLPDMVSDDTVEDVSSAQETTVISKGTTTLGGISSECSLDVKGVITGDVECQGRLCIYGNVTGNASASEIYVETNDRLNSDLLSTGNVKVCEKSVVAGMIQATSAFIGGAVKGDIDVDGPVVVDSSAVVYGNITANSLQVNNGAVLQGMCKIGLEETDIGSFFGSDES